MLRFLIVEVMGHSPFSRLLYRRLAPVPLHLLYYMPMLGFYIFLDIAYRIT